MNILKEKISRKEQIEKMATELFRERGYSGSSMRDLASVVGIEPASIYSHVKSKEEILSRVCFRLANQFMEAISEIENEHLAPDTKLKKLILAHVKVLTMDLSASIVFWNEWKHLTDPYLADFREMKSEYEKKFIELIKKGIQEGYFKNIEPKFIAMTILSTLNGISHWYKPEEKQHLNLGESLSEILINGIVIRN